MRSCYVAGPMRGRTDYHFPIFFAAEAALRAAGWEVFNPARMDVIADGWPNAEALDGTPLEHREGLRTDIHQLPLEAITPEACRKYARRDARVLIDYLAAERGDAIVLLPWWQTSTGANAEYRIARWVHLPTLSFDEALR